jgi:hypothetical protein
MPQHEMKGEQFCTIEISTLLPLLTIHLDIPIVHSTMSKILLILQISLNYFQR